MKLIITPKAEAQIDHQFREGVARYGMATAQKTFTRVESFFLSTLVQFPAAGTRIADEALLEWPITRTPFVVIYRIEADIGVVRVLGFFHSAQERSDFDPDT